MSLVCRWTQVDPRPYSYPFWCLGNSLPSKSALTNFTCTSVSSLHNVKNTSLLLSQGMHKKYFMYWRCWKKTRYLHQTITFTGFCASKGISYKGRELRKASCCNTGGPAQQRWLCPLTDWFGHLPLSPTTAKYNRSFIKALAQQQAARDATSCHSIYELMVFNGT